MHDSCEAEMREGARWFIGTVLIFPGCLHRILKQTEPETLLLAIRNRHDGTDPLYGRVRTAASVSPLSHRGLRTKSCTAPAAQRNSMISLSHKKGCAIFSRNRAISFLNSSKESSSEELQPRYIRSFSFRERMGFILRIAERIGVADAVSFRNADRLAEQGALHQTDCEKSGPEAAETE